MKPNMKPRLFSVLAALLLAFLSLQAQDCPKGKSILFVNEEITTFIVSGEPVRMMDISVGENEVVGNQPGDNIVRLKAMKPMKDGTRLGVVTVIGERNISQFDLVYVADSRDATTRYHIDLFDEQSYVNPEVEMSSNEMYRYCWSIFHSNRRYYDVSNSDNKLRIRLNNLYTVGGYFFFDISVENYSRIRFDIEEIRIKLSDKKQAKATNVQDIELKPVMQLNNTSRFTRGYRNVFVLEKLTFPDEKVLVFSLSEKAISGRSIDLKIDYADVLNADGFTESLVR